MRRNAVLFVLVSLLSGFGSTAMTLSAGLWILDLTGSVGLAALTGVCLYAPTYAAPWLGILADRLPRRTLLIGADLLLGAILLTLLTVHSAAGVWLIFAALLARGVSYVVLDAAETAILPAALSASALGDVNGWRTSAQEGMKLVAPLAGAGLYAWRGPEAVVLLSAAMPFLSAACYALLRIPAIRTPAPASKPAQLPTSSPSAARDAPSAPAAAGGEAGPCAGLEATEGAEAGGGLRAGLAVLLRNGAVTVPVLIAGVAIALSGLTNAAVLDRLVHGLQLPSTHLGILAAAQGAGSIVGGLIVGRLLARSGPAVVAAVGAALFGAGCVAWCLPWWPGLITGSVLAGLGLPWTLVAGVTAVQTGTPDHLLGRVSATATTVMFGPVALAIPLGAALVQLGGRAPLLIAAALATATAAWGHRHRLDGQRRPHAATTAA